VLASASQATNQQAEVEAGAAAEPKQQCSKAEAKTSKAIVKRRRIAEAGEFSVL
jgi:hypothetical protein